MLNQKPKISVIIVAHNQKDTIRECLESVLKLDYDNYEVIVVDDSSLDGTAGIAGKFPCQLVTLERHRGAAFARNRGAEQACGDVLFFLDSDVIVARDAASQILRTFQERPAAQGVQGVYSRESMPENIVTRYKDYFNDYKSRWIENDGVNIIATYCFAVKRQVFFEVGKFDTGIPGATVEDNDLGYRLFESGNLVALNKNLVVTHLKKYSLKSLLRRAYVVSFNMIKFFLRIRLAKLKKNKSGNFTFIPLSSGSNTNLCLAVSLFLSFAAFLSGICFLFSFKVQYLVLFFSIIFAFIAINSGYLFSLSKIKGWQFCCIWTGIFYLDMLFASFGVLHGGMDFIVFQRKY
jgi:glycosyltransferase involved in cell wall biosynthesis